MVGPRSSAQPWALLPNRVAVADAMCEREDAFEPRIASAVTMLVDRAYLLYMQSKCFLPNHNRKKEHEDRRERAR
jgi:hypothetical protein